MPGAGLDAPDCCKKLTASCSVLGDNGAESDGSPGEVDWVVGEALDVAACARSRFVGAAEFAMGGFACSTTGAEKFAGVDCATARAAASLVGFSAAELLDSPKPSARAIPLAANTANKVNRKKLLISLP